MALWFFIPAMYEYSVGWFADDFMWAYNFLNPNCLDPFNLHWSLENTPNCHTSCVMFHCSNRYYVTILINDSSIHSTITIDLAC